VLHLEIHPQSYVKPSLLLSLVVCELKVLLLCVLLCALYCRFGKRLLENVPAEERLMRGVPKNVSKVIIHHPTQVQLDCMRYSLTYDTADYKTDKAANSMPVAQVSIYTI
jgi:hypothetical protein